MAWRGAAWRGEAGRGTAGFIGALSLYGGSAGRDRGTRRRSTFRLFIKWMVVAAIAMAAPTLAIGGGTGVHPRERSCVRPIYI